MDDQRKLEAIMWRAHDRFVMAGSVSEGRQRGLGFEDGMLLVRGHPGGGRLRPSDALESAGVAGSRLTAWAGEPNGALPDRRRGWQPFRSVSREQSALVGTHDIWAHMGTCRRQTWGSRVTAQGSLGWDEETETKAKRGWF